MESVSGEREARVDMSTFVHTPDPYSDDDLDNDIERLIAIRRARQEHL